MLKKVLSICLSVVLVFGVVAVFCSCGTEQKEETPKYEYDSQDMSGMIMFVTDYAKTKGDSAEESATRVLTALGENYDSYLNNKAEITALLTEYELSADKMFEAYKAVCADYCKCIAEQDFDYYDFDSGLEQLYSAIDKGFEGFYKATESATENIMNKCEYLIGTAKNDYDFDELYDESEKIYNTLSDGYDKIYDKLRDYSEYFYDLFSEIEDSFYDGQKDVDVIISSFESKYAESTTVASKEGTTTAKATTTEATTTETTTKATTTTEPTTEKEDDLVDGMRPEFKEAMDSYETFMTDYVDFMKKFEEDPSDLSVLADYADYMKKYAEFVEDFEAWDDEEMNNTEMAYYIDVQARVSKKLLEVSE